MDQGTNHRQGRSRSTKLAARAVVATALSFWVAAGIVVGCSGGSDSPVQLGSGASGGQGGACATSQTSCSGACVDTSSDVENCGACGTSCAPGDVCSKGHCATTCSGGTTLCGATCNDTESDAKNCGTCGQACDVGMVCSAGKCALECAGGTAQCGSSCVDTKVDPSNCGACAKQCTAGSVCSAGVCALSCQQGLVNCNGTCVDPQSSNAFCGAKLDCAAVNAGMACGAGTLCTAGACVVTCQPGFVNCNGFCVDPTVNNTYCGASLDCKNANAGTTCAAGDVCKAGTCALTCQATLLDCDGVCVNPATSNQNCGATLDCKDGNAGVVCPQGESCSNGTCSNVCAATLTTCGDLCIDTTIDRDHCGGCTTACPLAQDCSHSHCCGLGSSYCGGACIDTYDDPANCGTCGSACGAGTPICAHGTCVATCPVGYTAVGTQCSKTYTVSIADVDGVSDSGCSTSPGSIIASSFSELCSDGETFTGGASTLTLFWNDTGIADGFLNVTRVDVAWQTEGFSFLESQNPPAAPTYSPFIESVALDGQPIGQYADGATTTPPVCPAAAPQSQAFSATAAQLSGYQVGGVNSVTISQPTPAPCMPTPGNCCANGYEGGLTVNPTWGPTAVAQITVLY